MFDRLGRLVPRLRFVFVAAWIVAAAGFGLLAPSLAKVGSADETSFLPADAQSLAARHVIAASFPSESAPAQALIVFGRAEGLTPADQQRIEGLRAWVTGSNGPGSVLRYVTAEQNPQLASMYRSPDGKIELARVDLSSASFLPETNQAVDAIRAHLAAPGVLPAGLTAQVTGQAGIGRDYLKAIQDGTDRTTIVTIVLVVLVLLLIYRAPLAALVPLLTIGAAFLVARGVLGVLAANGWKLSSVLDSFIVVLVFGVGTDYTIFLISRFREELTRNRYIDAIRVTVGRISAVITASAATVMVGLASMAVARFGMIQTTGPALAVTIFVTLLAGLTLTPSLLAIFGRRLFWPLHEQTRTASDQERGVWAAVGRGVTTRPGALAFVVLVALAVPALGLPQLKQSFDVLNELPATAESRIGFNTLSDHLGSGQILPLTVLVQVPDGNLASPPALSRIASVAAKIAAIPDVASVRSLATPTGDGRAVPAGLKPSTQLATMAQSFRAPPAGTLSEQLSDGSLANLEAAQAYVAGVGGAFPKTAASPSYRATADDLATLHEGILTTRKQALVANQLASIAAQLQASAGTPPTASSASQLQAVKAYLDELPSASPEVRTLQAYTNAETSASTLLTTPDAATYTSLIASLRELSAWFGARPQPVYFSPTSIPPSAAQQQTAASLTAARGRLPAELGAMAATLSPTDLYLPPAAATGPGSSGASGSGSGSGSGAGSSSSGVSSTDLVAAYNSASGDVTRLLVTTRSDPYATSAFQTVRELRSTLSGEAAGFGPGTQTYVGGATAEFTDVQTTISEDFVRVAAITIVGILLVLLLLLRSLVAPTYLVLTVLLSYVTSLSLSALILQGVFGQPGVNYFIPLMVFVLLVALGSDYNIFLMARVREESAQRGLRPGIRFASARTGTVITSAGLILAGTFGALVTSPLQLLFQVGVAVALGVLIDTFIVRSLLVPAITAFIGEWSWWPSRSGAAVGALAGAPAPAPAAGSAASSAPAGPGRRPGAAAISPVDFRQPPSIAGGRPGDAASRSAAGWTSYESHAASGVARTRAALGSARQRSPLSRPWTLRRAAWVVPAAVVGGLLLRRVLRRR